MAIYIDLDIVLEVHIERWPPPLIQMRNWSIYRRKFVKIETRKPKKETS